MDVGWIAASLNSWVDDCGNVWSVDYCSHGMFAQLELAFVNSLRRRQTLLCPRNFLVKGLRLAWMLRSIGGCLQVFLLKRLRSYKFGGRALCNIPQFEPKNASAL